MIVYHVNNNGIRMSTFFERLKEERLRMGKNQTDFAALGGVTKGSQINYESGDRVPDAHYLCAISAAGADVGYILTGNRSAKAIEEQAEGERELRAVTPRQARLLDLTDALDEEGLRHVQDIASKEKRLKELEEKLAQARHKK